MENDTKVKAWLLSWWASRNALEGEFHGVKKVRVRIASSSYNSASLSVVEGVIWVSSFASTEENELE